MKNHMLNAPKQPLITDALFAEMVLDKAVLAFRTEQLWKEIDQSLDVGNKERFFELTTELQALEALR
ncbi:IDEAL domain-containing protein [Ectobacillus antri]|uniref:IDEAL domain-containing protein n=1 Tax=Ectobacillus antri TaxID=2486280 RepID=A0ABT6H449_9BACI|nr:MULTISPECIES: IDEAL domain-containing protein [Ectobacillus]MDG4657053.1 IDEAL domain-containing protein [Ectobacillus antri]MDG5754155.1 IDEAL domain-containing protein [Ectobacillus antri]UOY93005.1 IDEAL domain-containing protein [Ectobacillus sp. JY-23]